MLILAWICVIFCAIMVLISFSEIAALTLALLFGLLANLCFEIVYDNQADEYVYKCICKEAKEITVDKFNKITKISVDGKIWIVKNKDIKNLQCEEK